MTAEIGNGDKPPGINSGWAEKAIIALAFTLGGWWLQNQWNVLQNVTASLADHKRHVAEQYVRRIEFERALEKHEVTLRRYEDRIDALIELQYEGRNHTHPDASVLDRGRLE